MDKTRRFQKPDHNYGYTEHYLKELLSEEEWKKFEQWIEGQTAMLDPNTDETIYYTHDVEGWIGGRVMPFD